MVDKQYENLDVDPQTVGASQLGTNQIPENMEPQVLDIKHGLNMPDGPTSSYSRTGNEISAVDIEPNPIATQTEDEDDNPMIRQGSS